MHVNDAMLIDRALKVSGEIYQGLTGIPQPRRNPVDRQMDAALRAFIGDAGAVTAYEFDLQMVQRINVRKTVFDGPGQRGVVGQPLLVARDLLQSAGR